MRKTFVISMSVVCLLLITSLPAHAVELTLHNAPTQVCFSPNGGCTDAVVKEIPKAKTEIRVQAYSFTSAPIAKALVEAHKRGEKWRLSWTRVSRQRNTARQLS
jgi:phosphatidylserine/phosphatidylglycerophosphate/cardiolipin synthase-like enzyme